MSEHIMPTYARLPVTFSHGQGVWLWDQNDERYLDVLAGIAVSNLGHAHPAVHKAICTQSEKLIHTSNIYHIDKQKKLADKLCKMSGMDAVFFSNSGAEANEAAIKIARLYGHQKGIAQPQIIVMENSFHGRTMATLSATGNPKVHAGFTPLVEGFIRVPFNDTDAVQQVLQAHSSIVAILVEPVQGEGGVHVPAPDYLNQLRSLCNEHQLLLMLDEIQTGIGRTGKFLAYQHNAILPDVCTLAKALGNGVPIGACLASGPAATVMTAGKHGSTFGGNPLACSAALAVLETCETEHIISKAANLGGYFFQQLQSQLNDIPTVVHIRHLGLMLGIELNKPCTELVSTALQQNLLINVTAEKTIRLLPPLIISQDEIDTACSSISTILKEFSHQ